MENVFYSNQFDDESMKFSLDKIIEALEKGLFVDTTRKESKETSAQSVVQMRNEARKLEKAFGVYYRQLKRIELMPFNEQLEELHLLFVDISNQYDPPMYSEEAHTYADELRSPTWGDESKEDPPFSSLTFDDPAIGLEIAKAKMLYVYYEIQDQLGLNLRCKVKTQQKIIRKDTDTQRNVNKKIKKMIAKGRPATDTEENGEEQFLCSKLFSYAKAIRRRLDLVNELQGLEKLERKYNILNWVLTKINGESGDFVKLCNNLPPDEYTFLYDSCCFEAEELDSLDSFVNMILKEQKRVEADDYYSSWLQQKTEGHFKSTVALCILVSKLKYELKDTHSLLESLNYRPEIQNKVNAHGNEVVNPTIDKAEMSGQDKHSDAAQDKTIKDSRKKIVDELFSLVDYGPWVSGITADDIKAALCTMLGVGKTTLTGTDAELSEKLWGLFEGGRKGNGGRVKIIWQNIVGFWDDKQLFVQKGATALNKDFFGDSKGYTNIDKGRPSRNNMSNGFREVLPLLEKYVPQKNINKAKNRVSK